MPRLILLVLASWTALGLTVAAADEKKGGKVAGIMFDRKETTITVKADGESEVITYAIGSDKKVTDAIKGIFNASRVELTYKMEGEMRQLVSIKRQILKASGTITGTVVNVHNQFWIELKPKNGVADAFAPGGNYKNKEFMDSLKALKPGDVVTIQYTTDGERHRIASMKKIASAPVK